MGETNKQEFYRQVNHSGRGAVFFKFVISPDPRREDTDRDLDLSLITRRIITLLEKELRRRLCFVAAVHPDHRPHRHVHGIFIVRGRLSKEHFKLLQKTARTEATRQALLQRKALDLTLGNPRCQKITRTLRPLLPRRGGARVPKVQPGPHLRIRRVRRHPSLQNALPDLSQQPERQPPGQLPPASARMGVAVNRLLLPVALTLSVLSAVFAQSASRLFTARFARLHEFIRLCIPKSDTLKNWPVILIGMAPFNRVFCVRPTKTQKELGNIIILGKTRVGKGLNITTNLLTWPFPVIVNDIKREFWDQTSGWRENGLGKRSFIFDPRGFGHKYDPLGGKTTDSDLRSAATILLHRPHRDKTVSLPSEQRPC